MTLAGVRLELGGNHWSLFAGVGALAAGWATRQTLSAPGGGGFSAGARWYHGVRSGLFVSANLTDSWYHLYPSFDDTRIVSGSLVTATLTVGARWRFESGVVLEAGIGGGLYRHREPLTGGAMPLPPGPEPKPFFGAIPDVSLGVGYEFGSR